jgi:hypothetical protein
LTLIAGTSSGDGILVTSAQSVTIRDTSITGFTADGIFVDPSAALNIALDDVAVAGSGNNGLEFTPTGSGKLTAVATGSSFTGNTNSGVSLNGEFGTGTLTATLAVNAAANGGSGIFVLSAAGQEQAIVMITGSKLANNAGGGLVGSGNVRVFVDRTQITGNVGMGWQAGNPAVVDSYKNNEVSGNTNDNLNGVVQISSE